MHTRPLAEAIEEAEQIIAGAAKTPDELAEGLGYLAGLVQSALRMAWAYQPGEPRFITSTGPYMKYGLDNPDTLYLHAYLRPGARYLLTGQRGSTADLNFQILNGNYTPVQVPDSLTAFDDRELEVAADGTFQYVLAAPDDAAMLVVRETYSDWSSERRGTIAISLADGDGDGTPPASPDPGKRYRVAGKMLLSQLRTFLAFPEWFYLTEPVNTLTTPRRTPGGLATQFSSAGHYELADDEAMIVTVPRADVPYQGIQLGSVWYTSLDYIAHQTSLTAAQARCDPDGKIRFVISERDPGVANWLELTGHPRGYIQLRWQHLSRDLTAADGPASVVVPVSDLTSRLPFHAQARLTPGEFTTRIAARRTAVAERMVF